MEQNLLEVISNLQKENAMLVECLKKSHETIVKLSKVKSDVFPIVYTVRGRNPVELEMDSVEDVLELLARFENSANSERNSRLKLEEKVVINGRGVRCVLDGDVPMFAVKDVERVLDCHGFGFQNVKRLKSNYLDASVRELNFVPKTEVLRVADIYRHEIPTKFLELTREDIFPTAVIGKSFFTTKKVAERGEDD